MTGMFTLRDTGTLRLEIHGQLGEVRICYHGEGQLRVSVMKDPHGIAIRRAWSSNRSQPYSGAIIHTGSSSSVPEPLVTLRGFADTCSTHTVESVVQSQEHSEESRILGRHLREYRHILAELKSEQFITQPEFREPPVLQSTIFFCNAVHEAIAFRY